MKNIPQYIVASALCILLLLAFSCKKTSPDQTCPEKILGDWVCVTVNGATPELTVSMSFEADGDGELRVLESNGIEHLYFMDKWILASDCGMLTFSYAINGFKHENELFISVLEDDALAISGPLLDLYQQDTKLSFQRR